MCVDAQRFTIGLTRERCDYSIDPSDIPLEDPGLALCRNRPLSLNVKTSHVAIVAALIDPRFLSQGTDKNRTRSRHRIYGEAGCLEEPYSLSQSMTRFPTASLSR